MPDQPTTQQLQLWVDRLRGGDESARSELLQCACRRFSRLTRKMLRGYPNVSRWEQTDDVLQNALLRLHRTLQNLTPATVRDYLRLAALNIRRELLDLARHYDGPQGPGTHHAREPDGSEDTRPAYDPVDHRDNPRELEVWSEFHRQAAALPEEEREVFDLLWYQGLSQAEATSILNISERTLKRRWQAARLRLYRALEGELPR
jgi:RNA polymerase sigma-70 factor (ECF subfamily)